VVGLRVFCKLSIEFVVVPSSNNWNLRFLMSNLGNFSFFQKIFIPKFRNFMEISQNSVKISITDCFSIANPKFILTVYTLRGQKEATMPSEPKNGIWAPKSAWSFVGQKGKKKPSEFVLKNSIIE
jgi:hypothetical protein